MNRPRRLAIGSILAAMTLTAVAAPADAADPNGTLAIVNGIPGTKVDVCLNGREIRSGLPYGQAVLRGVVATGNKNLKFFARDPRKCRGTVLARTSFPLAAGGDITVVVTKKAPKIVTFDNAGLGEIPPLGTPRSNAPFAIRSAADIAADFSYHYWNDASDVPITPSAIFVKGQQWLAGSNSGFVADNAVRIQATVLGNPVPVVSPIIQTLASHRYEWILVGTKRANARFVVTDRLVSNPSP
jgi:hypothetical protein